jgi:hypothetical protein
MCIVHVFLALPVHPRFEIPQVLSPVEVGVHEIVIAVCGASDRFIEEGEWMRHHAECAERLPDKQDRKD